MSHPETVATYPFTVFGCWPSTQERGGEILHAIDPRTAESLMQMQATSAGGDFWVCAVISGEVTAVDLHTAFVDPADPRNADVPDLTPDLAGPLATYTVLGIARHPSDQHAYETVVGERYADIVPATSPAAAEDVARSRLADRGGELWVCAVLEGEHRRQDTYATFADPETRPT